jgi:hypothetical protein
VRPTTCRGPTIVCVIDRCRTTAVPCSHPHLLCGSSSASSDLPHPHIDCVVGRCGPHLLCGGFSASFDLPCAPTTTGPMIAITHTFSAATLAHHSPCRAPPSTGSLIAVAHTYSAVDPARRSTCRAPTSATTLIAATHDSSRASPRGRRPRGRKAVVVAVTLIWGQAHAAHVRAAPMFVVQARAVQAVRVFPHTYLGHCITPSTYLYPMPRVWFQRDSSPHAHLQNLALETLQNTCVYGAGAYTTLHEVKVRAVQTRVVRMCAARGQCHWVSGLDQTICITCTALASAFPLEV